MQPSRTFSRLRSLAMLFCAGWMTVVGAGAEKVRPDAVSEIRIVDLQGTVEVSPVGAATWVLTRTNQNLFPRDRLRTGPNSRVALRWSDQSVVRFGSFTEIEIRPPHAPGAESGLELFKGILSFFHRDRPGRIRVITRGAVAGIDGTEFVMALDATTGRTTLSVIDGIVQLSNDQGTLEVKNNEQAVATPGQAPQHTAGFIAANVLQWCFYYPAVLDPSEVPFTAAEKAVLGASLAAYRAGDLLTALTRYPAGRTPASEAERVYHAALLLSVGEVEESANSLGQLPVTGPAPIPRLAEALSQLIAAVKNEPRPGAQNPELATELLAASYYEQSRARGDASLKTALELARRATARAPEFGFAWARVAELEFGFGHSQAALAALEKSLMASPRNPQALALKGFLLAAQGQTHAALPWFDRALAVDSALGNAWLGRGLGRIRRGDLPGGREDLLIAAALEPGRALLRSYLGKAYAEANEPQLALHELEMARQLDPGDPTAWLYSALVKAEHNRINEAIRDLEQSQVLNDNRSVYRSSLLLDQDRAVRSANLAQIYREAGMTDVSVREAGRALAADYANYSAHLFLANSYADLRDSFRFNLRYETPALSEYLIANLLSPVGYVPLSQAVSQQEYSRLLERNRVGVVSGTEYLSRGAWSQSVVQHGTFEKSSYALEGAYRFDPGERANHDFEKRALAFKFKQQITPADTVYAELLEYKAKGGDLTPLSDPGMANRGYSFEEKQQPTFVLGYHHEWSPGVHTLFLFGRLSDSLTVHDPVQPTLFIVKRDGVTPSFAQAMTVDGSRDNALEIYSAELQQIWRGARNQLIVGGRAQAGEFHTQNLQSHPVIGDDNVIFFPASGPVASQDFTTDFRRFNLYGYYGWFPLESLQLFAGLSYDYLQMPENILAPPLSANEKKVEDWLPKAGFVWTPGKHFAARFAYTRSLAGVSLEQSYRLEPTQVAGFNQSYRSLIPESVVGNAAGALFQTFQASLEASLDHGTYLSLGGEILQATASRTLGTFEITPTTDLARPSGTRDRLDYCEKTLLCTVDQLLGDHFTVGARYRISFADIREHLIETDFAQTVTTGPIRTVSQFPSRQHGGANLQQLVLLATCNLRLGFFSQFQSVWYAQKNRSSDLADDSLWQLNVFVGYRFPKRRAEITAGILNLTGQDYRLNPLNLINEPARDRTLVLRCQFNF